MGELGRDWLRGMGVFVCIVFATVSGRFTSRAAPPALGRLHQVAPQLPVRPRPPPPPAAGAALSTPTCPLVWVLSPSESLTCCPRETPTALREVASSRCPQHEFETPCGVTGDRTFESLHFFLFYGSGYPFIRGFAVLPTIRIPTTTTRGWCSFFLVPTPVSCSWAGTIRLLGVVVACEGMLA
jgi:hypothetical protein